MTERIRTEFIAVHCSATKPSQDIGEDEIRLMHKKRGWSDIGYNIVIRRSGKVDIGRPLDAVGAHVKSFNHISLGVCMVGGVAEDGTPENNFTPEQWSSLETVLRFCNLVYPEAVIQGHRDFSPDLDGDGVIEQHEWLKECPCFDAKGFAKEIGL